MSFDCIVVGAGVMGLSSAWYLQHEEKAQTLLLDQYPFPNGRGSSSGHSRIFRNTYRQPEYTALMRFALQEWRRLEGLSGRKLLHHCGLLAGGPSIDVNMYTKSLRENNVDHEVLPQSTIAQRWPVLAHLGHDHQFLYEPLAGFMAADVAMQTLKDLFSAAGGCFRPNEKFLEVRSTDSDVEVITSSRVYHAKSVILTAGPWNIKLLENLGISLPLQTTKTLYTYFPVRQKSAGSIEELSQFDPEHYPVSMYKDKEKDLLIYSIPSFEFPGHVKFGMHAGVPCDPDRRDRVPYPQDFELRIRTHVAKNFPQLEAEPSAVEYCMYTESPDEGFVLDHHPHDRRIVFGTGFSGHGFKLAPAVGRILSELALGKISSLDTQKLRLSRFATKAKL